MKKLFIFLLFSVLIYASSLAQPIGVNTNLNNNALAQTLAGPGVVISNVTVTAAPGSYGQFTSGLNGAPSIGIAQGVLLTSGGIQNAVGPNNSSSLGTNNSFAGNGLLNGLGQGTTQDATVIEFDIRTTGTSLRFNYVFGSEEYHQYVNSQFNDVFGLFISGPGIPGTQNIALIPGTNTPVAINTVNNGQTSNCQSPGPGVNSQFFVDNCNGGAVQYDGFTRVLQAIRNNLQSCQTYHVTLAIADVGDGILDSGVFIAEGSFNSAGGTGFTVAINCNNGNWSVTATATDPMVINNQWQLWETDVEGATTGGTLVSTFNGGLVRTFSGLDLSKHYYIRHISTICGTVFETRIAVPDFSDNATPAFNFEDANGTVKNVFCVGEPVFLDGTASTNYDRYYLNVTRRVAGTNDPFQHHADYGWTLNSPIGVLNLSHIIQTQGLNPGELFEAGFEYEVQLAIMNPNKCVPWTDVKNRFTVICCEEDPSFTIDIDCNGNWSAITTPALSSPLFHHSWQLFETTVEGATSGGTPVGAPQTGTTATFSWLDLSKSYYIVHTIWATGCDSYQASVAVPDFSGNGTAFFTLEDENGVEKTVFCAGENVFMDGTGSNNYDRFFLNATRRPAGSPPGTPFQHHADYGWTIDNSIGVLNLSFEFLNNGLNPGEIFEPGFEYEIFLAIANIPDCIPWTEFRRTFTVICCDADPAFTVEANCFGGNWSVTATPIGTEPTNHSWQLYETTVNGATSGGTPVGASQNGTTATFTWLDQSKFFYIKHRIWINGCYVEEFSVAVPGFSAEATLTYKIMNEAGQQKEVYCFGEDIYLDATGSSNYDRYFMAIWRRPIAGGPFTYYANYGWTFTNNIGIINLSQLFLTSGENPGEIFEPGYVYELQFAISNPPNCVPWIELKRQFIVECCEDFLSANFKLDLVDSEGGFSLIVYDFKTYGNVGATHTWTVLSSPNPNGGPYTQVLETTTTGAGPITLYNQGSSGLYYFVIHKVSTLCGDICYGKRREGHNGTTPGSEPDGGEECDLCGPIDCALLDEICFAPENETAYCSSFPQQAVTFVWSPVQGATQYRLEITYNDPTCCGNVGIPQTANYNISNVNYITLGGLQRYCFKWRVGVVCEEEILWTEYHCFTGCDAIPGGGGGIGLAAPEQGIIATAATVQPQVYPNPANDELNVVLPLEAKADLIKVIDQQGKVVFEQRSPEQHLKIDSSKLIAGMYAIQIIYPDGSQSVEQIVITH